MRLLTVIECLTLSFAAVRRPLATLHGDGRKRQVQEYMFNRDWFFDQEFYVDGRERWRKNGEVRVSLKRTRIAYFKNGLKGIWNYKQTKIPYMEMEIPLNKEDSKFLLYKADVKTGRYFSNSIEFSPGTIYLITSFVPTKETTQEIGSFTVKPAVPKPMVDRNLKC